MPSDWFRFPETGDGTLQDPVRPDTRGYDVDYAGGKPDPNGPPQWVVRVYGDAATLDALADEPQVVRLDSVPVQALNQMLGQERDAEEWERDFRIQTGDT